MYIAYKEIYFPLISFVVLCAGITGETLASGISQVNTNNKTVFRLPVDSISGIYSGIVCWLDAVCQINRKQMLRCCC